MSYNNKLKRFENITFQFQNRRELTYLTTSRCTPEELTQAFIQMTIILREG
jgi:hypothetical protein